MTIEVEWRLLPSQAGTAVDWALWSKMPTATVLNAVVLSLGVEPLRLPLPRRVREAENRCNRLGLKFRRRYELACTHVSKTGPLHPVGSASMLYGPGGATVSLPAFGAWAIDMGWELPERFPRCESAGAQPRDPTEAAKRPLNEAGRTGASEALPLGATADTTRTRREWTPSARHDLLTEFRLLGGKRPQETGKKGTRGALAKLGIASGVDKDTLGLQLDQAIDEKKKADIWASLNTAK